MRLVVERLSGDSRTAELAAHTQDNGDTNNVIVSVLVILGVVIFVINMSNNVSIVSTLIIVITTKLVRKFYRHGIIVLLCIFPLASASEFFLPFCVQTPSRPLLEA